MRLLRPLLALAALLICLWLVAAHGVRGILILVAVAAATTLPRTKPWRMAESWLVRLTGSRQRAAALVFGAVIAVAAAVNVYQLVR